MSDSYSFKAERSFAKSLDESDHLRKYRAQFHIPKNNVTSKSQWPIGAICIFINWIQSGFGPHSDPSVIFIFISIFGLFCRVRSPLSNPAWVIVYFFFLFFLFFFVSFLFSAYFVGLDYHFQIRPEFLFMGKGHSILWFLDFNFFFWRLIN